MNELFLPNNCMPVVCDSNHFINCNSFLHPDRCLDFHVLLYIKSGIFYVTEDEIDYEIPSGNVIFFKSGLRHYGKKTIPAKTEWFFIHFYLPQDEQSQSHLPLFTPSMQPLPTNSKLEYQMPLPKTIYNIEGTKLEKKIMDFPSLYHSEEPMRGWLLNLQCFELLTEIAETKSFPATDNLSDKICAFLSSHKCEMFSSKALEDEFFLSYKHLSSIFKKEKHMTMQQYHTSLRIQKACYLLTSTLMPISEISASLGYSDMLYFSRCFHQLTGESPTRYRQTHYQKA